VPFVDELASGIAPACAPDVASTFGSSGGTAAGAILFAFHALAFFVEPPLLAWSERVRARRFSAISLAVLSIASLAAAFADRAWIFLGALALYGPASGCALSVSEGLLVEARPDARERTLARLAFAGAAGDLAVPALLAILATFGLGWRAAFVIAAVVAAALSIAHACSPSLDRRVRAVDDDDDSSASPTMRDALRTALSARSLLAWSFAAASATLLDEILVAFAVVHLQAIGVGVGARAWAIGAWVVGGFVGLAILERVVSRVGARRVLFVACAFTAAASIAIAFARAPSVQIVAFFFVGAAGCTLHPLAKAAAYASLPGRPAIVNAVAATFSPFDLIAPLALAAIAATLGSRATIGALLVAPIVVAIVAVTSARAPATRARDRAPRESPAPEEAQRLHDRARRALAFGYSRVEEKEGRMGIGKRAAAEFFGTFWLVFGGCGSAVLAAAFPGVGIGLLGVSLAFGLTVLTMAYAIGHVSGCHLNPAVTIGLVVGKRFAGKDVPAYLAAQVLGAIAGAGVLYVIASGKPGFAVGGFAANGYGDHSPGGYSLVAALVAEVVLTFAFLMIILGSTDERAPKGFAPIPIGLGLTLIHLIGIPVTNLSVNPARSTGPAIIVGGWALSQLWAFWVAPIVGAALAGVAYGMIAGEPKKSGGTS
jgi:aquaporin Z